MGVAKFRGKVVTAAPEGVEERVEQLVRRREARLLDTSPARPVGLVRLRDPRLTKADALPVDTDGRGAFGVGDLVAQVLGLFTHEPVHGEGEEVRQATLVVVLGDRVHALKFIDGVLGEEFGVAVVHGGGVAGGFAA